MPSPTEPSPELRERFLLNLPIPAKLALIIGVLSLALLGSLALSFFSMDTISAMRAYVGGESLWSKAQKQAGAHLARYTLLHHEVDYGQFLDFLSIPEGDHRARVELDKPDYEMAVVRDGFLKGGNNLDDIAGMTRLFRRFRHFGYMERAIEIWTQGDSYIARLRQIGDDLHRAILSGHATPAILQAALMRTDEVNRQLTPLEDAFSATLGDAARFLKKAVAVVLVVGMLLLWMSALTIAFLIARHLTSQIQRLRDAATRVAEGDYSQPIVQGSRDEIGDLSLAFQHMMMQRQRADGEILTLNQALEQRVKELGMVNKELDSFCYSVSHDLRAPLRAMDGFSQMLEEEHAKSLDPSGRELLGKVRRNVQQMGNLIEGLLTFSRLSLQPIERTTLDLSAMAQEVANELQSLEKNRRVQVTIHDLGTLPGDATLMRQVFRNLLGNAFKFTRHRPEARVEVGHAEEAERDVYFVRDNGAGFDKRFARTLFGVFQRFHSDREFEGNGVGLALVQRIIIRHGGTIWAESVPDRGATFYFAFPRRPT